MYDRIKRHLIAAQRPLQLGISRAYKIITKTDGSWMRIAAEAKSNAVAAGIEYSEESYKLTIPRAESKVL